MDADVEPEKNLCCCGCHVHKVSKWWSIVALILTVISTAVFVNEAVVTRPWNNEFRMKVVISVVAYPVKFFAYGMLLYGSIKKRPGPYYPALFVLPFGCVIQIIYCCLYMFFAFMFLYSGPDRDYITKHFPLKPASLIFVYVFVYILATWLECYMTRVVYRSYRILRDNEEPPVVYDQFGRALVCEQRPIQDHHLIYDQFQQAMIDENGEIVYDSSQIPILNDQFQRIPVMYDQFGRAIAYDQYQRENIYNQRKDQYP